MRDVLLAGTCLFVALLLLISPGVEGGSTMVKVAYDPTDEVFVNPERGFYVQYTSRGVGRSLHNVELRSQRFLGRSLILRLYYLQSFRHQDLNQQFLDLVRADLDAVRRAGLKAILRFAYADGYEPDAPLSIVLRHIEQLHPVFAENYDVIAVVQAGFIGAWGEWHSSTNDLTNLENRRAILLKLLEALPNERMVQVRTPEFKRSIFGVHVPLGPDQAFDGSDLARTGHHNDCFLASDTDYGTYRDIVLDQEYLHLESRYVAMGGETCTPQEPLVPPKDRPVSLLAHLSPDYERHHCPNAVREMEYLHWSYLNSGYHGGILASWRADGCMEEIERRLGYRFQLVEGEYSTHVPRGGTFQIHLELVNTGFAAPFNPRRVELILRNQSTGQVFAAPLSDDPRRWLPGEAVHITAEVGVPPDVPAGSYELLLHLPDPAERLYGRPEYSIRLANEGVWEERTGFNSLLHVVEVLDGEGTEHLSGIPEFAPYRGAE